MPYVIEVMRFRTGEVVQTIGKNMSERQAETCLRGVLRNLNTEEFCATMVKADASHQAQGQQAPKGKT